MVSIKPNNNPRNIDISNTLCAVFKTNPNIIKIINIPYSLEKIPDVYLYISGEKHHHFSGVNYSLKADLAFLM